jgi:C1A family cysteine protease
MKSLSIKNLLVIAVVLATIQCVLIKSSEENIHHQILSNFMNGSKKELFKVFHFLYKKEYELDSKEGIKRYNTFKQTLKQIEEINASSPNKLGITDFTDLTQEEYEKKYIGVIPKININSENYVDASQYLTGGDVPRKVDWSKLYGEAREQLSCGSCWAFATSGAIEGNMKKNFNIDFTPSVQQMVDCSTENNGCHGGIGEKALDYLKQAGVVKEKDYLYDQVKHTYCNDKYRETYNIVDSYQVCNRRKCPREKLMELISKGPVISHIDGSQLGFKQYTNGLMNIENCVEANHAILLIGYDADQKYWIIRNSHNNTWGMNGIGKIPFWEYNNSCFLDSQGILPVLLPNMKPTRPVGPEPPRPPQPKPDPGPKPPRPVSDKCITVYKTCKDESTAYEICNSQRTFDHNVAGWKNGKFLGGRVCSKPNCSETCYDDFFDEYTCIANSFIDQFIKSVGSLLIYKQENKPKPGCVRVFKNYCSTGTSKEYCNDVADLSDDDFETCISSWEFDMDTVESVSLYDGTNFSGVPSSSNQNTFSLFGNRFDKKAYSLKINKKK